MATTAQCPNFVIVMINWLPNFVNHSYDYRLNWTPLSPITIIKRLIKKPAALYRQKHYEQYYYIFVAIENKCVLLTDDRLLYSTKKFHA